jgi:hypothetical protein
MTSTSPHIITDRQETSAGQISITEPELLRIIFNNTTDIELIFSINSILANNSNSELYIPPIQPTPYNEANPESYNPLVTYPSMSMPTNTDIYIYYTGGSASSSGTARTFVIRFGEQTPETPPPQPTGPNATAIVEAKRVELTDYLSSDYVNLSGYNAVSKQQVEYIRNTLSVEIMNAETELLSGINNLSGIVMTLSDALSTRIDTLSGEVKTLSGALSTRIDTLSGEVMTLSGALSTRIDDLSGEVKTLSGALSTRIDDLSGEVIALSGALSTRIDTLSGEVMTLSGALSTRIDTLSGEVMTLSGALSTRIDTLSGEVIALSGALSTRIDTLSGNLLSGVTDIRNIVNTKINQFLSNDNASTVIDSITELLSNNYPDKIDSIYELETLISGLQGGDLSIITNNVTTLSNTLNDIKDRYFRRQGDTVSGDTFFANGGNTTMNIDVIQDKVNASNMTVSGYFYMDDKWRIYMDDNGNELRFQYSANNFVGDTKDIVMKI